MFLLALILITNILNADINSDTVELSLMGNLEGRSIIVKVSDLKGNKLGVFKPTSGSTLYRGEYASYMLGVITGTKELYPETTIECMNVDTQKKIRKLIADAQFSTIVKEENRLTILQEITRNIEKKEPLCGAYKPWINNMQFYYDMGTLENLKKHPIFKYMLATGPQPKHKKFLIKQCTQLVEPKGCLQGNGYVDEMAKDMNTILLIDAVMDNRDRFPGGNLHFIVINGHARLFSLDNGAVLKPLDMTGFDTLKKLGVSRFKKNVIKKLRELNNTSKQEIIDLLKITPEEYEIFKTNLEKTLEYIEILEAKYKKNLYFLKN